MRMGARAYDWCAYDCVSMWGGDVYVGMYG